MPLKEKMLIEERLSVVNFLIDNEEFKCDIEALVRTIGDLERIGSKIATGKVNPRELLQLARALRSIAALQKLCATQSQPALNKMAEQLNPCLSVCKRIEFIHTADGEVYVLFGTQKEVQLGLTEVVLGTGVVSHTFFVETFFGEVFSGTECHQQGSCEN